MIFSGLSVAAMLLAQATVSPSQLWPPPLTTPSIGSPGSPPSPEPPASYGKNTEQHQPPSVRSQ